MLACYQRDPKDSSSNPRINADPSGQWMFHEKLVCTVVLCMCMCVCMCVLQIKYRIRFTSLIPSVSDLAINHQLPHSVTTLKNSRNDLLRDLWVRYRKSGKDEYPKKVASFLFFCITLFGIRNLKLSQKAKTYEVLKSPYLRCQAVYGK